MVALAQPTRAVAHARPSGRPAVAAVPHSRPATATLGDYLACVAMMVLVEALVVLFGLVLVVL